MVEPGGCKAGAAVTGQHIRNGGLIGLGGGGREGERDLAQAQNRPAIVTSSMMRVEARNATSPPSRPKPESM